MTKGTLDSQSLPGVAINSKNTGVRGDSNATLDNIKFHLVCVCRFFRADFTVMRLCQYDTDEFDFHTESATFNCLSKAFKWLYALTPLKKLTELLTIFKWIYFYETPCMFWCSFRDRAQQFL